MDLYLRKDFRISDDYDSYSIGQSQRFRCISKQESSLPVKAGVSNALTVADLTDNPSLVVLSCAAESTATFEFTAVQPAEGAPISDAPDMVIPFTGLLSFQPLYATQRISKITISSAIIASAESQISIFYAGA